MPRAPERAWPWLAQMGAGRAGWHSWDVLDDGGRRSAAYSVDWLDRLFGVLDGPSFVGPAARSPT